VIQNLSEEFRNIQKFSRRKIEENHIETFLLNTCIQKTTSKISSSSYILSTILIFQSCPADLESKIISNKLEDFLHHHDKSFNYTDKNPPLDFIKT